MAFWVRFISKYDSNHHIICLSNHHDEGLLYTIIFRHSRHQFFVLLLKRFIIFLLYFFTFMKRLPSNVNWNYVQTYKQYIILSPSFCVFNFFRCVCFPYSLFCKYYVLFGVDNMIYKKERKKERNKKWWIEREKRKQRKEWRMKKNCSKYS
jgi:hypothetical protein